jgi:hypothetical protein
MNGSLLGERIGSVSDDLLHERKAILRVCYSNNFTHEFS